MFKVDLPPDTGPIYTYTTCCECDQLRARVAKLEADKTAIAEQSNRFRGQRQRFRKALEKIASYCNDKHRVMMLGVQGFGTIEQIAKAALREVDGGKD